MPQAFLTRAIWRVISAMRLVPRPERFVTHDDRKQSKTHLCVEAIWHLSSDRSIIVHSSPTLNDNKRHRRNRLRSGQGELKDGATRFVRLRPQPAAVGFDDGPADRQAHPNSTGLCGVEWFENAIEKFGINTRPGVAHGDEDPCLVLFSRD